MKRLALAAALMLLGAACAREIRAGTPSPTGSPSATIAALSPTPSLHLSPEPAEPIVLPPLPPQGVVVSDKQGVRFVGLDGRVVAALRHFSLYYEWTVPGPVILRHQRHYFLLRVAGHALRPLPSRDDAAQLSPQFQEGVDPMSDTYLDLPLPRGGKENAGFWAYALPSPDRSMLLEQWSGECEAPTAFLAHADGSDPLPVTGSRGLRGAGESVGLGWTSDDRAVVNVFDSGCGNGMDRPGIYLLDRPGHGILLLAVRGSARMWGPA